MTNKSTADILSSVENGVCKIILNRPKKRNAITTQMYQQLTSIINKSKQDNNIYMVILSGTGPFFTSGNDMSLSPEHFEEFVSVEDGCMCFKNFIDALITFPKLLIAVVNGPAIGVGVTILALFDMVYASDKAYFQTPFSTLGLVAEGCSTYTFSKIMGKSKAGDMLYLSYKMSAAEAKEYHLVSDIFKHDRIDDVWNYLNKVSTLSIESILATKALTKRWNENTLLKVNEEEVKVLIKRWESPDLMERIVKMFSQKSKM